ncbi:MAG: NAD(P)-binding protein [Peptococcaceae bacterium]|nr:NAD(P)-binding protein [Peptococcaceae bacterium]
MTRNIGIEDCIRGDMAPCGCVCPFGLDTRDFIEKIRRGSFDAAFKTYRNAVVFPDIVARLCPEPCKGRCVLRGGEAVEMRALERAGVAYARNRDPINFNIPPKEKRAAVVGAGLSGLTCALRLAGRGYRVTVYEKSGRAGGRVFELMPEDAAREDIERQLKFTDAEFKFRTEITSLDEIEADGVYIATGAGGMDFGLRGDTDLFTGETSRPGVFLGGELTGAGFIQAIADGIHAARYFERWLMVGVMLRDTREQAGEAPRTRLRDEFFPASAAPAVRAASGEVYSKDEAKAEAFRCLKCNCEACTSRCDLMEFFRVEPKVIKERVDSTLIKGGIIEGNSKRLISACNQCGGCRDACPAGIDVGALLLESRRALYRDNALPTVWNEFWQRDMEFSNGGDATLFREAPGAGENRENGEDRRNGENRYAFFPGCQLGASDPRYVSEAYRWILRHEPDTALMLCCCGAPAVWGGREREHAAWIAALRGKWMSMGKPVLLAACSSCKRMLEEYLPESTCRSVYEIMAPWGAPTAAAAIGPAAVFDPCSSRREPRTQESVRALLRASGADLEELPASGEDARCCGWGGNAAVASPQYVEKVTQKRAAQSEAVYVAYCVNCRDSFARMGKESLHVFDVLFGLNGANRPSPDISRRRENRLALRAALLREFWGEEQEEARNPVRLAVEPELARRLDAELILEDDLREVIEHCETSGRKLIDRQDGRSVGHLLKGAVTYWVEYEACGDGWRVLNAYSHRLMVQEQDKLIHSAP